MNWKRRQDNGIDRFGGSSRLTLGLILMTIAMLSIPLVDGLAKYLSVSYSPLFLGWARYAVACLIVLPFTAAIHGPHLFPAERRGSHVFRTVFLVTAMTLYFLSIARIPLATAVSTYFVGPIIAAVLSVIVLKERMTARKALSLTLGFVGSIVILRPGGSMDLGILLALGAGIFLCVLSDRHPARRAGQRSGKDSGVSVCHRDGASDAASRCVLVRTGIERSAFLRRAGLVLCHQSHTFDCCFPSCRCINARAARLCRADWRRSNRLRCVR